MKRVPFDKLKVTGAAGGWRLGVDKVYVAQRAAEIIESWDREDKLDEIRQN